MRVTVRTLDSKNTEFDVDEGETVKEFKEKVALKLEIPVERQRIIFRGKVLHDEKLMKEYNVDGCVVHLVQRAPPSTDTSTNTQPSTSSSERSSNERQSNVFIGAFQGANDMTNVTQQLVENLLSTFGGAHGAATVTTSSMGDGTSVNVQINMQADEQLSSHNDSQQRLQQAQNFITSARNRLRNLEVDTEMHSAMDVDKDASERDTLQDGASMSTSNPPQLTNTPQSLADVIRDFQALYVQLEPSLTRYQNLLCNPQPQDLKASDDNLPDGIAEIFHSLSHGLHALSDVTFNFRSPQPQTTGCFPRISPVTMPPNVNVRSSTAQTDTTSAATSTSSASGQPHFHVQPHPHTHSFQRPNANGSQTQVDQRNPSTAARTMGVPHDFSFSRPIGVSATVIQIPRFPTFPMQNLSTGTSTSIPIPSMANAASVSTATGAPIIFSNMQQTMTTGVPRSSTSTNMPSFSSSAADTPSAQSASTFPSSSASFQTNSQTASQDRQRMPRPTVGLPFPFNPINPTALAGHPDPLVPCQSFHFGPRFQQAGAGNIRRRPHIVAEVSSVVIEHIPGVQSQASNEPRTSSGTMPTNQGEAPAVGVTNQRTQPDGVPNLPLPFDQSFVSNILSGMFAPQPGQPQRDQENQQQTQNQATQQSRQEQSSVNDNDDDHDDDDDEDAIDVNDTSRIYEVVQRAVMDAMSGTGQSRTIRGLVQDTMNNLDSAEEDYDGDASLPSQFISFIAEQMTVNDILQLALGFSNEPLLRLAPHLVTFIEKNFNHGQPVTRENIPAIVEKILQEMQVTSDLLGCLTIRPEVDLRATFRQTDAEFVSEALKLLLDQDNPSFPDDITALVKRYISVVVAVQDHCITGGFEEYLRLYMSSEGASRMLRSVDSPLRDMFRSMIVNKIRTTAQSCPPLSAEDLQKRIVLRGKTAEKSSDSSNNDDVKRNGVKRREGYCFDARKSWHEIIGSEEVDDDGNDDDDYQIPSDHQEWHRHVPPEWIAVITRDAKRQRSQSAQRPFSDAYYSGLPPKRRKAIGSEKNGQDGVDFNSALQNSIAAAKVEPKTSKSELSEDLEQQNLSEAFQDSFRRDAGDRLRDDGDYRPKQFPNCHDYFFGKQKKK